MMKMGRKYLDRTGRKLPRQHKVSCSGQQPCACLAQTVKSLVDEYLAKIGLTVNADSLVLQGSANENVKQLGILQEEIENTKQEYESLQRQKDNMAFELENIKKELDASKETLTQKQNEIASLESDKAGLQKERDRLMLELSSTSSSLDYYRTNYAYLDKAYNTCLGLPERMRYELRGVFGDLTSPAGFFCGALNPDHLESLWDYVASGLNNGQIGSEDEDRLKQLFDFCFAAVNQSGREPRYRRFGVMPGAEHDDRKMQLASESRQLGKVAKVLLDGYCHATSGKPVRSSLVTLA